MNTVTLCGKFSGKTNAVSLYDLSGKLVTPVNDIHADAPGFFQGETGDRAGIFRIIKDNGNAMDFKIPCLQCANTGLRGSELPPVEIERQAACTTIVKGVST